MPVSGARAAIAEIMAEVEGYKLENDRLANELRALQSELSKGRHDSELQLQESLVYMEVQRQATEDLQMELAETVERYNKLDTMCADLHDETLKIREQVELEQLRAVEVERTKWEAREERLVRQLQELQIQLAMTKGPDRGQSTKNYPQAQPSWLIRAA